MIKTESTLNLVTNSGASCARVFGDGGVTFCAKADEGSFVQNKCQEWINEVHYVQALDYIQLRSDNILHLLSIPSGMFPS